LFLKSDSVMEPRTGYFCADGIWMESTKDRHRRRCKEFVHKVQKKSEQYQ